MSSKETMNFGEFFDNPKEVFSTHLDLKKLDDEVSNLVYDSEMKWAKLVDTTLSDFIGLVLTGKTDLEEAKSFTKSTAEKKKKLTNEVLLDISSMVGEKVGEAFSTGYIEGFYETMQYSLKLFRNKLDEGFLTDADGRLSKLLDIMEKALDKQSKEAFKGKNLTFYPFKN